MPYTTISTGSITAAWANANVRDQSVTPFASVAARDAAITVPVQGMICVTTDTNTLWVRTATGWSKFAGAQSNRSTIYIPRGAQQLVIPASQTFSSGGRTFLLNNITVTDLRVDDQLLVTANIRVQNTTAMGQAVLEMIPYFGPGGASSFVSPQRLVSTSTLAVGADEMVSGTWLYTTTSATTHTVTIQGSTTAGTGTAVAPDCWMTVNVIAQP